ncbi:MAG: iron uptake porin, partial [Cyanobacteria bacterium P01_A01_bin.123]
RGNQAMTRYEFAAGLNSCLDRILEIVGAGGVTAEDLEAIRQLQQQFQAELAQLRGRVDALEADVAELEANQFSTTTKLRGQVDSHVVVPLDTLGGESSTTFVNRARLNFDTSFTGEDRLRIRLQAGNDTTNLGSSTGVAGFGLANSAGGGFDVEINDFFYTFPVGDRLDIIIGANSIVTDDFVTSTIVPFDGPSVLDAGGPALYDFGMGGSSGAGFSFAFTENIVLDAGYSVDSAPGGDSTVGIFAGAGQSYIGQLSYISDGLLDIAVAYLHGNADATPTGLTAGSVGGVDTDTYAGLLNLDFGGFMVGGYFAYHDNGTDDTTSYMGGVSVPNLFGLGNELGVYGGIAPSYTNEPLFVEGYYAIGVNEFLTITPSVSYLDPDGDGGITDTGFFGAIRATFTF